MAALKGPRALRGTIGTTWPGHSTLPLWSTSEEAGDGGSSVSSGCFSGSSGGHVSPMLHHVPWRKQPPPSLRPKQQPQSRDTQLELLKAKIRSQARRQASYTSLGTSAPSSASYLYSSMAPTLTRAPCPTRTPTCTVLQNKVQRMKSCPCKGQKHSRCPGVAARDRDSDLAVYAWRKGRALAKALLGPPPSLPRFQKDLTPTKELGASKMVNAGRSRSLRTPVTSSASVSNSHLASAHLSSRTSSDTPGTLHTAMSILRDLRHQIQTGLELARSRPRMGMELGPRDLRGKKQPWKKPESCVHFSKTSQARAEGQGLRRAESYPLGQIPGTQRHRDPLFRRPQSHSGGLSHVLQRPWSASAGWGSRNPRIWPWEEREATSWGLGNSPAQCSWSASFTPQPGAHLPPRGPKLAWQKPTHQEHPKVEKKQPLTCPKPLAPLAPLHNPESLRYFMRQRAQAQRCQALEEKALAARARKEEFRRHREAVLGTRLPGPCIATTPKVSQTNPSIVTFVPSSAQFSNPQSPEHSSGQEWSKVTSGTVLGNQEAPGSFCLCLNRSLSHMEPLEPGSRAGISRRMRPSTFGGRSRSWALGTRYPYSDVCISLGMDEAGPLGAWSLHHLEHKQAQVQALETMANVLKQRVDVLTARLQSQEPLGAPGHLGPDTPLEPCRLTPTIPTAQDGGVGAWRDCLDTQEGPWLTPHCPPDCQTLPWTGDPGGQTRAGFTDDNGAWAQAEKLVGGTALSESISSCAGSLAMPDPACGSPWLDEMPIAQELGSGTPWTNQSFGRCGEASNPLPDLQDKTTIQESSLSSLKTLKAELELCEAQKDLEQLLFRQRLQRLTESHPMEAEPDPYSRLRRWTHRDYLRKNSRARSRSHALADLLAASPVNYGSKPVCRARPWAFLDGGHTALSWAPKARSRSGTLANLTEHWPEYQHLQDPAAKFQAWENPILQELRAQTQDTLLRLREMAFEEKVRSELAWKYQRQGYPSSLATVAVLSALGKRQQEVLSRLEQQQRDMRALHRQQRLEHLARELLLDQQRDLALVQRSLTRMQQELWLRSRLSQGSHQQVEAAQTGCLQTCLPLERPAWVISCPSQPQTNPLNPQAAQPPGALQHPDVTCKENSQARSGGLSPAAPQREHEAPLDQGQPKALLWTPQQVSPLPQPGEEGGGTSVEGHQVLEIQGDASTIPQAPSGSQEQSILIPSTHTPDQQGPLETNPQVLPFTPSAENGEPREQRTQPWQVDPQDPQRQEVPSTSPEPGTVGQGAPSQLQAPEDPDSESTALPGTPVGSGSGLDSAHTLSWSSLQDFQKVSAILVQLSPSSTSLSDPPNSELSFSGGSWTGVEVDNAPVQGNSPQASHRSGSELSVASSEVWGEETPPDLGPCSDREDHGAPPSEPPTLGLEASGSSGSNLGKGQGANPEASQLGHPSHQLSLAQSGSLQAPQEAVPSPSTHGCPQQASPELLVCVHPQTPSGSITQGDSRIPLSPEETAKCPCFMAEVSDSRACANYPPLSPESNASEDFPPPPDDAVLFPGGSEHPAQEATPTVPERPFLWGDLGCSEGEACLEEEPGGDYSPGEVGGQSPQQTPSCPDMPRLAPEAVQMLWGDTGSIGSCRWHLPGGAGAKAVDQMSTQLTRKILWDTLAALSELPADAASASQVPEVHTTAAGPQETQRC